MNYSSVIRGSAVAGLMVALMIQCGCAHDPKAKAISINVQLDPAWTGGPVLVDLVAVNLRDLDQYRDKSMTEYWVEGDSLRAGAPKKSFTLRTPGVPETLAATSPEWKAWLAFGAQDVLVLADLPGKGRADDKSGDTDPRRRTLSLKTKANAITVVVKPGGLEVQAPSPK